MSEYMSLELEIYRREMPMRFWFHWRKYYIIFCRDKHKKYKDCQVKT